MYRSRKMNNCRILSNESSKESLTLGMLRDRMNACLDDIRMRLAHDLDHVRTSRTRVP